MVEITTTTAGCDYVSVSWTTTGSSVMCRLVQYNVTFSSSSSTMDVIVFNSSINTYHFTVLPNNTQFNINVTGINVMGNASEPASASVGMCMLCGTYRLCVHILLIRSHSYDIQETHHLGWLPCSKMLITITSQSIVKSN